jgi:NADH-quinone oxidoreductase subunit I
MLKALGYLWELIRGCWITARHFIVNMGFHTLKLFGIKTKRKGAVTIQYPEQKKELASRHRSLHRLMKREDGKPRCVVCMLCVTVCPSECIYVEAAEDPDPEIQKYPSRFVIDLNRCCFCGFCVEACPEDALRMDTAKIDLARYAHQDLIYDLEKLLQ